MLVTIWLLYLVEFADWNSQVTIGYGCYPNVVANYVPNGGTDTMPYHTGTMSSSRTQYNANIQYRNIENMWAIKGDWVEGVYYSTAYTSGGSEKISTRVSTKRDTIYFKINPTKYSSGVGRGLMLNNISGIPTKFKFYSIGDAKAFWPSEITSSGSSIYACDQWYSSASLPNVFCGTTGERSESSGLFHMNCASNSTTSACRIQELP